MTPVDLTAASVGWTRRRGRARCAVFVITLAVATMTGCGKQTDGAGPASDHTTKPASTLPHRTNLRFIQGHRVATFTDASLRCGEREEVRGSTALLASSPAPGPALRHHPYFELEWAIDDVEIGKPIQLPSQDIYGDGAGGVLFFTDPKTGAEASTNQEDAHGTITFLEASCSPNPRVLVEVDGFLGSEYFEEPTVKVQGTLALGT